MNTRSALRRDLNRSSAIAFAALLAFMPSALLAQTKKKNLTGRLYVSSLSGESQISKGGKVELMSPKSAYNAEGSVIETKLKATSALVFSNGTGVAFASETRIDVLKFDQEAFAANRTNLELEPSISNTDVLLARGVIALCTSKLAPGTTMIYRTTLGSISVRGDRLVIEAEPEMTRISMLEGEGIVRGGNLDLGGEVLKTGQQAVIRRRPGREAPDITIGPIPASEHGSLEELAFVARSSRQTVFFDTKETSGDSEIVPVPVVPSNLPNPITISPSRLPQ